jgi:hypothetical protein
MTPPNITPGPWRQASTAQADEYTTRILAGQGTRSFRVAETFAHPNADTFDEAEANARAIAAIPDLLKVLEPVQCVGNANINLMSREQAVNLLREIRDTQRAALLKAGYTF